MATAIPLSLFFLFLFRTLYSQTQSPEDFIYNGFNDTDLIRQGATLVKPSGALKLTNTTHNAIGHAFFPKPVSMKNRSFSTSFVFAIVPSLKNDGGYGFAFTISPSTNFEGAQSGHYLGVLNSTNDGNESNHIILVEFDTVDGHKEDTDTEGDMVGININGITSNASEPAAYYEDGHNKEQITLESKRAIQAWIEYDGVKHLMNVTITPVERAKPSRPLISYSIDLSSFMKEQMYVGFSAATGPDKSSNHYILGWSFRVNGSARELNISQLPLPPEEKGSTPLKPGVKVAIAILSSLLFFVLVIFGCIKFYRRMLQFESLEDWELECPHRFQYKDLHIATKGFKESEVIGIGGFGAVYRGVLPTSGIEVAVKKISSNSIQGLREFAAEIESLGRLRHKNLVNLQGWCKRKNNLLLVYDYIENGSLDYLLFKKGNFVLIWEQRFAILKGITSGLLYLHEEWEQVVIHRDIKSSNVLIDADMRGRLGDFGLARLYDHGENSHTTNIVGTIGYIAPELARSGRASTSSDVFAYGVFLLEVACGRRPIASNSNTGQDILMDWVMECHQAGRILDAADPRLDSSYDVEEMELVLQLGLLCSRHDADLRPTMRQVTRYLNGDDPLPSIDNLGPTGSRRSDGFSSKFLEYISSDTVTSSYNSVSTGNLSSTSIKAGR